MLLLARDRNRRTWRCGRVGSGLRSSNGFEQALRRTLRKPPDPIRDGSLPRKSRSHLLVLIIPKNVARRFEGPVQASLARFARDPPRRGLHCAAALSGSLIGWNGH